MTLPRFMVLARYWAKHPPIHLMVAAYLGFSGTPGRRVLPSTDRAAGMAALLAAFPAGRIA
jgi:hypothetical protein